MGGIHPSISIYGHFNMGSTHRLHYTKDQRHIALGILFLKENGGVKLAHVSIDDIEKDPGIHRNMLSTIWERNVKGEIIGIRRSEGYKKQKHITTDIIRNKLTTIYLLKRGTVRSLSKQLKIGVGSLHISVKQGIIRIVINHVKTRLTNQQIKTRINFIIDKINLPNTTFVSFNNYIHLDEKWFYYMKINKNLYMGPS